VARCYDVCDADFVDLGELADCVDFGDDPDFADAADFLAVGDFDVLVDGLDFFSLASATAVTVSLAAFSAPFRMSSPDGVFAPA
jgi:hypothetical protein